MYGFDAESALPLEGVVLSDNITTVSASKDAGPDKPGINEAIAAVNDSREEKIPFSAAEIKIESVPEECVYVSIDDIGVKHQKDSRKEGSVRDYKYVENTVAHIQYGDESYILTGIGMRNVFKSVLAFLLVNNLLSRELVFLTDGAQDIRSHIQSVFQFHPYRVILDWFHLKKRCQEWLSMAIRGKDRRNAILEKALHYLWVGDVAGASEYLSSLDSADIKNRKWLDNLLGYFQKKRRRHHLLCAKGKTRTQEFQQSCRKSKRSGRSRAAKAQWNGLVSRGKRSTCRFADDLPEQPA